MALSLVRFSWPLWGGKEKELVCNNSTTVNSPISSYEMVKFLLVKETKMALPTTQRGVRRKWQRREERMRRVDRDEYEDIVLVSSDGSDYDYVSDWSIGWLEPLGSDFQSSDVVVDDDDSFAVLVPCYRHGCKEVGEASNNVGKVGRRRGMEKVVDERRGERDDKKSLKEKSAVRREGKERRVAEV